MERRQSASRAKAFVLAEACASRTHRRHQRCRPPVLKTGKFTGTHSLPLVREPIIPSSVPICLDAALLFYLCDSGQFNVSHGTVFAVLSFSGQMSKVRITFLVAVRRPARSGPASSLPRRLLRSP